MQAIRETTSVASDEDMSVDDILSSFEKDLPVMDKLAEALTQKSHTDMVDQTTKALIECAKYGIVTVEKNTKKGEPLISDLTCAYCLAHLNQPMTMLDGISVCQGCVSKYLNTRLTEDKLLHGEVILDEQLGFGKNINVILNSISKNIMSKGFTAAKLRQEGNGLFRSKEYNKAIEKYTEAIQECPQDIVLYSNRAAAYISISQNDLATKDTHTALYLCKIQGVGKGAAIYRRCISRLVTILQAKKNQQDQTTILRWNFWPFMRLLSVVEPAAPAKAQIMKGSLIAC